MESTGFCIKISGNNWRKQKTMRYLVLLVIFCYSCQNAAKEKPKEVNDHDLFIYKIKYGNETYWNVTGIALVKDKVYYLPNDSMLMTYKSLPGNAKAIDNSNLRKLLQSTDSSQIAKAKDLGNCNCKWVSKNMYVIRYKEGEKESEFVLTEVGDCDKNSPCYFLDELRRHFTELHEQDMKEF